VAYSIFINFDGLYLSNAVVAECFCVLRLTFKRVLNVTSCKCTTGSQEHECGTCMMVLRAMRVFIYCGRWIDRGGPIAWAPRSPDLIPLDFYLWGHLKTLVYAAPVDNEEALYHSIVDACQTIRIYRGIFEQMQRSIMRRVEAGVGSHVGRF
jgi:hypothetical protein